MTPGERHGPRVKNWSQQLLDKYLKTSLNCGVAKNAILFIGDGMGVSTQFAARVMKGQRDGQSGEEAFLDWETWQHCGFAKTYNTDYQVPDSAGTATAYLCGVKAKQGTVGLDDTVVKRGDCGSSALAEVSSIAAWAQAEGKSTGLVTTSRVTHASPAALFAHAAERNWEAGADIKGECRDIALQLIEDDPGKQLNVILGGGREKFTPDTVADVEYEGTFGDRIDGRNLIDEWIETKQGSGLRHHYVWNVDQLNATDIENTDYLLGM
ncbi:PREDICTED: alkaline phosphatase, tissue-nonspecific isozyme-like [Priapulus caudatus]|uniref:Alkaline phosphatase n=1 Tax=Priapulus caudatus TaxID=37621 RepID=A0ABM1F0C1_PRICU|nr:PREDICTED: alkaline phosphatase, tissue-nonspecific isozyme-like [Priapulus caudatus]